MNIIFEKVPNSICTISEESNIINLTIEPMTMKISIFDDDDGIILTKKNLHCALAMYKALILIING